MNTERKKSPIGVLFLTVFVDLVGFSISFPLFPDMLEYYSRPHMGAKRNCRME